MTIRSINNEWVASYKGAIGWGASVREAIQECWKDYRGYYAAK